MSRAVTGDTVQLKPSNNIYTALLGIAIIAELLGFFALFLRFSEIFGGSLFS